MTLTTSLAGAALRGLLRVPPRWLERPFGAVASEIDGHTLDPQVRSALAVYNRFFSEDPNPVRARASFERDATLLAVSRAPVRIEDRLAHSTDAKVGVHVRIYRPQRSGPHPTVVYFHGGGGVVGSVESYDQTVRAMCARTGCAVVSVDYRLAPEHAFPTATEDAMCALSWVFSNAVSLGMDATRIAVAGDSMGGNLAALVALQAAKKSLPPLAGQLLIYPWVDLAVTMPSTQTLADGYMLTRARIEWFAGHYLQGQDARQPEVSPLYSRELQGLPPAIVVTAGFDPLRDEGIAYAGRLADAGVEVDEHCYSSLIHGFFSMGGGIRAAQRAFDEICDSLASRLAG